MKFKFIVWSFALSMMLFSCGNDKKTDKTTASTPKPAVAQTCTYTPIKEGIKVHWTAFKTTKRIGVKGTFDDVKAETKVNAKSISNMINATTFLIHTSSVNSNNEGRDKKLVEFFFGKFASTDIAGLMQSALGDNMKGEGNINLTMNGMAKDVPYTYTVEGDILKVHTVIDTDKWNGQKAIASINKACKDKHTGADGVSKTWNDVDVVVEVPFTRNCK